jgi:hypothetical protein
MEGHKRKIGLSIVIILLILANTGGMIRLMIEPEVFQDVYSVFSSIPIRWLAIIPFVSIISLIFIWVGRRWAVYMAVVIFLFVLILVIYAGVWPHAILITVSIAMLLIFCWQSREFFV